MKEYKILVTHYEIVSAQGESKEAVEEQFIKSLTRPADMLNYQIIEVEESSDQAL